MSEKDQLLIVNDGSKLLQGLQEAIEQLDFETKVCRPCEALEELKGTDHTAAVVLATEKLSHLENEFLDKFAARVKALSMNMLVLADEAAGDNLIEMLHGHGIFHAHNSESCEMLKGRLAMLFELRGQLHELTAELKMQQAISQPLNTTFTQVGEEMQLAARLQRDFLPQQLPQIEGIRFASIYRPATWVSGDIYDVMRLDERHVGFYVADVVGHGMPAALLTIFIKQSLVTKRISGHNYSLVEPGEVLEQLNEKFVEQQLHDFQFATCCYGILDIQTLQLRLANAGHPFPMRFDRNGQLQELETKNSLLGVFPGQKYFTESFQLQPGDKLLVYSDGMELAFVNEGPDKPLRFRKEFEYLIHLDIETMCNKLVEIIEEEEGSLHPRDDVTIVGIELADH